VSPRHPDNTLNELSGEEWLYFTKSVWGTAYPSELGHGLRKQHGANKPPRLMARLVEFFTVTGELVLDPFAGVGGTLLGAAIARGPRRALGLEMRLGDSLALLPEIGSDSIDFIATDPPYNIQLPLTMSGGKLAEQHANRRTDYAMVTDHVEDLANSADYATYLDRMEDVFGQLVRVLRPNRYAAVIVRDAYQEGRYIFTGSDLADRATRAGFVVKGDVIWYQAGTRLRPYGYPHSFVPNISHQHVLILRRETARKKPRVVAGT